MTVESDTNEPNEFAFAGDGTGPQPARESKPAGEVDGESIAVPAGDLTGAVSEGIEEATQGDRDDSAR